MPPILLLISALGIYLAIGAAFAAAFVTRGVQHIDPAAAHARWHFRLLILPGSAALWPLLLRRWLRRQPPPPPAEPRAMKIERLRRQSVEISPAWIFAFILLWFIVTVAGFAR